MPFKSKAQARWMFANKPKMAKEWAEHTPSMKSLPNYTDPKHSHPFSLDAGNPGKCLICGQMKAMHHIK